MNIYRISQSINNGWDTFDSAVVVARSTTQAKSIHPNYKDGGERDNYTWADPKHVTVEKIGVASNLFAKKCVICASFNAG